MIVAQSLEHPYSILTNGWLEQPYKCSLNCSLHVQNNQKGKTFTYH